MGAVKGKPGYNLDAPELIERCLHCTKPECTNCLGGVLQGQEKKARSRFTRWDELKDLYGQGLSYQSIGARRNQYYLSPQARYTVRDRATGAVLARGDARACARQLGMDVRTFVNTIRKSGRGKGSRVVERVE